MEQKPKELSAEETQIQNDRYRFGAFKYSLRAPDTLGPNDIIAQTLGAYAFPRGEEATDPSLNIYDKDAPI